MQFTVARDDFAKALAAASGVVSPKATLPILSHLLLSIDEQGCFVQATDLDVEITWPFAAEVIKCGAVAVPARLLHDVVRRMPADSKIEVSIAGNRLKVAAGKSRFELVTLDAKDYPDLEVKTGQVWSFEIEADRLRGLFASVRHAIGNDETRHYLGGVYLHVEGDGPGLLRAVATNGHMLMRLSMDAPAASHGMPGVILPKKTVAEILKLLPTGAVPVTLTVSDRLIVLALTGGTTLASKLIDGRYPDYWRVIPSGNPHRAVVPADELAAAIDRVATFCDKANAGVTLAFKPGGPITVAMQRIEIGSGQDRVQATIEGAGATIGFNHRYLTAMLGGLAGSTVELHYRGGAEPVLLRLAGSDNLTGVLMPMRTMTDGKQLEEAA